MENLSARKLSRHLTDRSQKSLKLADEQDEVEGISTPVVPREIFDYLSNMISPERCSKKKLFKSTFKLLKTSTKSTWVELFLVKGEKLKNTGTKQAVKTIDLDVEDNLPAYSVVNKKPVLLTNPHTNPLYSKFATKIKCFSTLTLQEIKVYCTACIPLYDNAETLFAVVQLFNKVDDGSSQSFFSTDDVKIVSSLGKLFGEILRTRNEYLQLVKHNKSLIASVEEQNKGWRLANQITRREIVHKKLLEVLKDRPKITKKILKIVKDSMNCDHATIFISNFGLSKPLLECGESHDHSRIIKLIEYCCFSNDKPLNIPDLSVEPLINNEIRSKLNSCLLVPFKLIDSEAKAILCFLRESKEFSKLDLEYAVKIAESLSSCISIVNEGLKFTIQIDPDLSYLNRFSIFEDAEFDFYELLSNVRINLGNHFNLSSCTIYIANQSKKQLWTRNSNSMSSLLFPHSSDTLIGRTYEYGEIICLPDPNYFMLTDLNIYEDKHVISLPISSDKFKDPVIGVLVCIRKVQKFSEFESWLIEKHSETLAVILESIFLNSLPYLNIEDDSSSMPSFTKSPDTRFIEVNKNKFNFDEQPSFELDSKNAVFSPAFSVINLSAERLSNIQDILKDVKESLDPNLLYEALPRLAYCEKTVYYLISNLGNKLENVFSKEQADPSALQRFCIEEQEIIYVKNSLITLPADNQPALSENDSDYIECQSRSSFIIIPVLNQFGRTAGIMHFVNPSQENPDIEHFKSLGLFTWLMSQDLESKQWATIIDETHGEYALQQWSRYLIQVANSSITKMLLCKNAVYQLSNCNNIAEIMKICLDVICVAMNCTYAEVLIDFEGSICRINKEGYKYLEISESVYKELCIKFNSEKIIIEPAEHFIMYVPFEFNDLRGYLKLENNPTGNEKKFEDFRISNEEILKNLCSNIGEAVYTFPETQEASLKSLVQCIKLIALQYQPVALNYVINMASKSIVDSERGTFFTYRDEQLIAGDQGIQREVPTNFTLSANKGIASNVFLNCKSEIVQDCYSDPRFDPSLDKLTGYKTTNVICVPLVTEYNKIGVLEVLNKKHGRFTNKDLKLLERFGELVCMVLEIVNTMQVTLEERFRLLAISNIMENHILVFDENKSLVYMNKPIEKFFGVKQEQIMKVNYFGWLHGNRNIMEDLEAVFDNPILNIRKTSQKIKLKKFSYNRKHGDGRESMIINYRVSHLKNFSADCSNGVILIIEDASALAALHKEFKAVQAEIRNITTPIGTDTKLQKCIRELGVLISHIDNPELKESIQGIINTLKAGGLKKPKLKRLVSDEYNIHAISSILGIPEGKIAGKRFSNAEIPLFPIKSNSNVTLAELRNWELNAFTLDNHLDFIVSMLDDFDVIQHYKIELNVLLNFSSRIREKCNSWNNPFHNFFHCFNVMHGVYMMLATTPAGSNFDQLQIFSLLIAALCHDVDHRGRGNMFEVNSKSLIATTYHDKSVLEQHHAAVAFFTMQEPDCNIFSTLSRDRYLQARKLIITSILGTDMSKHLLMLEKMNNRFKDLEEKAMGKLDKDIEKLAQLLMHAGDLSHPCKSYRNYEVWSVLVCQEFTDQYKQEVELGLPITEFMKDLDKPKTYYANEVGFLTFVVKPLWDCLNLFLAPHIDPLVERLGENISIMKGKLEEWKKAES